MKNLRFRLCAIVCITACLTAACSYSGSTPDIIPVPENVRMKSGAFSLDRNLAVSYLSEDLAPAAGILQRNCPECPDKMRLCFQEMAETSCSRSRTPYLTERMLLT